MIFFPSKEFGTIIIYDKQMEKAKFLVYDVFKNDVIWRLPKNGNEEVFASDSEARVLLYSKGNMIFMASLHVNPGIDLYLRPVFFSWEHLRNPGKLVEEKQELQNLTSAVLNSYNAYKTPKKLL